MGADRWLVSGSELFVLDILDILGLFLCWLHTFAKWAKPEEAILSALGVLVVTVTGGVSSVVDEMVPGIERPRSAIMPP